MPSIYVDTCGLGQGMVLPLSEPRLGPNMLSAARTSCHVIGQLAKCLIDTSISSLEPGCIMMFWNLLALAARLYACCVYFSAFCVTVFV